MRTWRIVCSAAVLTIGLATGAHADEWNKLTYLTFSGPVNMPGITLPAGTYRFELMDPVDSRRVIRVSDKEGTKNYGIFLSISDQKLQPSDNAVVMFKEMPAGSPQAIRAWFYPGETTGYEFVYPHDQALKIAKATHQPVLSMNERKESTKEADRVASMRGAQVGKVDENGRSESTDERLKESSSARSSNATAAAKPTGTSSSSTTASNAAPPSRSTKTTASTTAASTSVGTSGTTAQTGDAADTSKAPRRHLPRTASNIPLMALLSGLTIIGALGLRMARKSLA
jgi:hypothetical protein